MPQEHVKPSDIPIGSDDGDPITKKKKKKHKLREADATIPEEHVETSDIHAASDDGDPIPKRKKKKHRLREEDATMPQEHVEPSDIHIGSDDGDLIPKKKKKKKHRLREEEATAPINVISFVPSEALAGSNDGDPVLKKKKKNRCTEEKIHEPESALRKCVLIDQMDESSDGVSILKKKKPKKLLSKEFIDEEINEKSSEIESDEQKKINKENIIEDSPSNKKQNSIINDIISRVLKENRKRNSSGEAQGDTSTLITDIYSPPCPDKITGELYNVVTYIMKENIPISKQNTMWSQNCKPTAVHSTSRLHSFTEEEDMQIRTRFKFLVDNHVVKKPRVLLQQLEEQAGHVGRQEKDKTASDIVGLYVGQDLHNRLAHSVTQRLLFLLTGSSLENRIDIKKTKEEPVYKITQKSRGWSLDEDKILIKNVLTNNRNPSGVSLVQDIVEKEVNWEKVFKSLEEYGRDLVRVRERWNRYVKGFLLEEEQGPEDRQEYLAELAKHVLGMGVKDKKEIKWKAVAPHFHPKTTQMLDFWSLIKRSRGDTLTQKLENSLAFLQTAHSQNLSKVNHKKKSDKVLQLRDYYASLLNSCESEPSI